METTTTSNLRKSPLSPDGTDLGQSASDKVGFYGATPVIQPTSSSQAVITNSAGGTASASTGLQALTSTYNSTLIANSFATVVVLINQLRADLVSLGLIKGS